MSTIRNILREESQAVAVYDTVLKKCVLIFSSNKHADKYLFETMTYKIGRTRYLVNAKGKTSKNFFNKSLAFRIASLSQQYLVNNCDAFVLDDNYMREKIMDTHQLSS
jgi:hypothetical protein